MTEARAPQGGPGAVRPLARLGSMTVREFLARYWQRRPAVIRQALPGFRLPFAPRALFELSELEQVESRLLERTGGRWRLRHGPFRRGSLPSPKRPGWTLLVQGVDLHLEPAARLLAQFRFLPDARLDDLMVSYASDGGGVGPHVDSYDVFLLQALGTRRWRIERRPDPACVPDAPVRRLSRFRPEAEWILEPGDLLYLPPGVAHDGVAVGNGCITCSIGFRTPSWADLAAIWSEMQSNADAAPARFRDAGSPPSAHPARLPRNMVEQARRELLRRRPGAREMALGLLRQLTEPKPRVIFEAPAEPMSRARFAEAVRRGGLSADRRTRMLYSDRVLGINGELVDLQEASQRALLRYFADRRVLPAGTRLGAAPTADRACMCLYEWYLAGWVHPA